LIGDCSCAERQDHYCSLDCELHFGG
jgi:hypothetical protein